MIDFTAARRRWAAGGSRSRDDGAEAEIDRLLGERERLLARISELASERRTLADERDGWRDRAFDLSDEVDGWRSRCRDLEAVLAARCPGCGRVPEERTAKDPRSPHYRGCLRCWRRKAGR